MVNCQPSEQIVGFNAFIATARLLSFFQIRGTHVFPYPESGELWQRNESVSGRAAGKREHAAHEGSLLFSLLEVLQIKEDFREI